MAIGPSLRVNNQFDAPPAASLPIPGVIAFRPNPLVWGNIHINEFG
ncbi:MAG TPA: hypothetical protein VJ323_13830 [Bryobacteraceae bacterium]|nr:hypothetical protein [Bryobacteraceae bacterium]